MFNNKNTFNMSNFVHFSTGLSSDLENYYKEKEYRMDIIVEVEKEYFEVYFFTKSSLEYEMTKDGFFSFPGMIIVDEITYDKIITSITKLIECAYFLYYRGHSCFPKSTKFINKWYTNEIIFSEAQLKTVPL